MNPECELMTIILIRNAKEKTVLTQFREKRYWSGLAFPGGHVEPGEGFGEAIIREAKEETGLAIRNPRLCGLVHWEHAISRRRSIIACYQTKEFEGELIAHCEEGEHRWVPEESLHALALAPWLKEQLIVFESDSVSELFYVYDDEGVKQVRPV